MMSQKNNNSYFSQETTSSVKQKKMMIMKFTILNITQSKLMNIYCDHILQYRLKATSLMKTLRFELYMQYDKN